MAIFLQHRISTSGFSVAQATEILSAKILKLFTKLNLLNIVSSFTSIQEWLYVNIHKLKYWSLFQKILHVKSDLLFQDTLIKEGFSM